MVEGTVSQQSLDTDTKGFPILRRLQRCRDALLEVSAPHKSCRTVAERSAKHVQQDR